MSIPLLVYLNNPILQCNKKYNMLEEKMDKSSRFSDLLQLSVSLPIKQLLNILWGSNLINKSMNSRKGAILEDISRFKKTLHFCRENHLPFRSR